MHILQTPPPPTAFQSSSGLLLGGVYPTTGGLSGKFSIKSPRDILKDSKVVSVLMRFGRMFQSLAAFTPNESSYAVENDIWALKLNGGILTLVPSRADS